MPAQRTQTPIDLGGVFEALERPLGLVEDLERRAAFQRYLDSARIHLERSIFDLLAKTVEAVNEAGSNVKARLEYQGGALHLVVDPVAEEATTEHERVFNIGDEVEKVTIRIPAELKELIAQAANLRGTSINSWYIRELARSVRDVAREFRQDERREERDQRREERQSRRGSLRGFVGRE
jgi:uncharacterized protein (DUF1778 family)